MKKNTPPNQTPAIYKASNFDRNHPDYVDREPKVIYKNPIKRKGGTYIENIYFDCKTLTANEKIVLFFLHRHAGKNEEDKTWPFQETLANRIGLSVRTVKTIIKSLQEKKFITSERRGLGLSNIYKIEDRNVVDAELH